MKDVQELIAKGRLTEAEALAKQYQEAQPGNPEVYYVRALLHRTVKSWQSAGELLASALSLKPDEPRYAEAYGLVLAEGGRLEHAQNVIEAALQRFQPTHGMIVSLATVFMLRGEREKAEGIFLTLLDQNPGDVVARIHLAECHYRAGRDEEAVALLRELLAEQPDALAVRFRLAQLLGENRQMQEGHDLLAEALRVKPSYDHWLAMARFLEEIGRSKDALEFYRRAVRVQPRGVEALTGLGRMTALLEGSEAGARELRKALEADPRSAEAHQAVAKLMQGRNDLEQALDHARRAVDLAPNDADALLTLGMVLFKARWNSGESRAQARALLLRASAIAPRKHAIKFELLAVCQALCDWEQIERLERELLGAGNGVHVPLFDALTMEGASRAYQLSCARVAANKLERLREMRGWTVHDHAARIGKPRPAKLRVGYLSADLRDHATSVLAAQLFEAHDRSRFEWFAYSSRRSDGSAMRARVEKAFDQFIDVSAIDDKALADRIAADGIDILVDMNVFTSGTRTAALTMRPAPVQVAYLGFPGTSGASFIDYIVTDDIVTPLTDAEDYSERLARVRGTYQCNDATRAVPAAPARSTEGLPNGAIVFCCFNQHYKIRRPVFDTWAQILRAVPDSVLWLFEGAEAGQDALRRQLELRGLDASRLIFAQRRPHAEHLARLQLADLALDTLPYNMHTTASDALWAGVPVITTPGETFASRVGASLLNAVGLPELVTPDLAAYRDLAIALASDPKRLGKLRKRLAAQRIESGAFDGERFARQVESLYEQMWTRFSQGLPPEHLDAGA